MTSNGHMMTLSCAGKRTMDRMARSAPSQSVSTVLGLELERLGLNTDVPGDSLWTRNRDIQGCPGTNLGTPGHYALLPGDDAS